VVGTGVLKYDEIFKDIVTLDDFKEKFTEILGLVKIWFRNYKLGKARIEIKNFSDREEALQFIHAAAESYRKVIHE